MKLLLYILLLQISAGALMPMNDYGQLAKLKFLVEHYNLHVEEARVDGTEFDVIDFIYLHYISPDSHTHKNPVDHNQLPLKKIGAAQHLILNTLNDFYLWVPGITMHSLVYDCQDKGRISLPQIFHPPTA